MKKIFTLLLTALTAWGASAADFQLFFGDTPVADGATYTIGYELTVKPVGNKTYYTYTQNSDLYVQGPKGAALELEVKSDNNLNVCSFDGECVPCSALNNFTVTKQGTCSGDKDDLAIDYVTTKTNDTKPKLNVITANVKVTCGGQSIACTVILTDEENAGVANLVANTTAVKLNGRSLAYNTPRPAELSIYSILGTKVMSVNVNGHGNINLATLSRGVYVYRLGSATGKIIVK